MMMMIIDDNLFSFLWIARKRGPSHDDDDDDDDDDGHFLYEVFSDWWPDAHCVPRVPLRFAFLFILSSSALFVHFPLFSF